VSALYVYEDHAVIGRRLPEFEEAYRERWLPALSASGAGKLVYYFDRLLGEAHHVVTISAVADGASFEAFTAETQSGKLNEVAEELTLLRYSVSGKLLSPVPWSPAVDLAEVPAGAGAGEVSVFLENIAWPDRPINDFIDNLGASYEKLWSNPSGAPPPVQLVGAFRTATPGSRPQMTVLQRLADPIGFLGNIVVKLPPDHPIEQAKAAGLQNRDRFWSNLLMTSTWSPCR